MTTPLERLTCSQCGSPVPLSSEAETACPACQAKVVVPERHREARRATEQVLANEAAARRWLDRAGHEPPAILNVFTFLDGGLFWGLVFPAIFLPMGVCLSTTLVPAIIRSVAHVRVVDVWADTTQGALSVGLPFLVLTLGLLISGFARKRVLAQAGLRRWRRSLLRKPRACGAAEPAAHRSPSARRTSARAATTATATTSCASRSAGSVRCNVDAIGSLRS